MRLFHSPKRCAESLAYDLGNVLHMLAATESSRYWLLSNMKETLYTGRITRSEQCSSLSAPSCPSITSTPKVRFAPSFWPSEVALDFTDNRRSLERCWSAYRPGIRPSCHTRLQTHKIVATGGWQPA